jgi:pimeloyl-ACP methyl ester carboxylesterase
MPTEVIMPRVDMDMTEGTITDWHVTDGDEVTQGMPIFDIETSKAAMEIEAPANGVIRQICASIGETVAVGTAVAWIYASGEALEEHGVSLEESTPESVVVSIEESEPESVVVSIEESKRIRATPAARRVARERGISLESVTGSGPNGRISAADAIGVAGIRQPSKLNTVWFRKGAGIPLVMLHGFAAESNSWRPFVHALSRVANGDMPMLGVDLPSHGKSSDEAAGSLDEIVAAIEATLLNEGITQCHLLGHSFGGAVAIASAAHIKARIQAHSLTLLAPAGLGPECNAAFIAGITQATKRASLVPWLKTLFANPARLDEAFIATAEQQLCRADVRARLQALADTYFPDGVQGLDLRDALAALRIPVSIVWGQRDRVLPPRHADGLPGRMALHRFADAGHLPHVEALDEVAEIVARNTQATVNRAFPLMQGHSNEPILTYST